MRINRWLVAGFGLVVSATLSACTESNKGTLAEMERLQRDVNKKIRLVKEQNEQINSNMKLIKAEMDTIQNYYIPAVSAKLDSVAARPEQVKIQMIAEVENRLKTITDNVREYKTQINETVLTQNQAVVDSVRTRLTSFDSRISKAEQYVHFVLTKQDSVNQEFAVRIDKRPWYRSILGMWDDRERARTGAP